MKFIQILLFSLSTSAFANSQKYEIKIDWTINHKFIGSATKAGVEDEMTTFTYSHDGVVEFFEVTPKDLKKVNGQEGIFLGTTLGKTPADGKRIVIHNGTLVLTTNPDVQIMLDSNSQTEHVFINMTAKKVNQK
jgi:hypothetical protein